MADARAKGDADAKKAKQVHTPFDSLSLLGCERCHFGDKDAYSDTLSLIVRYIRDHEGPNV